MECLIGVACKDFALIAADATKIQQILVMKDDDDKMYQLSNKMIMGAIGDSGDRTIFAEFISKNMQLYKMRNSYELSPSAAANFTRRKLADYLRSSSPYQVNLLLAGHDDKTDKFELFFMDYLASMVQVPYAAHGYGGLLAQGVMDQYHRKDMTLQEGYEMIAKCVSAIQKRLVLNLSKFKVRAVTKDGIVDMPDITPSTLANRGL